MFHRLSSKTNQKNEAGKMEMQAGTMRSTIAYFVTHAYKRFVCRTYTEPALKYHQRYRAAVQLP